MTATSSQGLALMAEVVYIAASMRAPIVMALGNRALSGPINIHCDHSDSMLIRDSGVVQLFAENAQEAYDLMVMAPRIAEHPRRPAAGARLPGRLHDHALGRAGRAASRRRRRALRRRRTASRTPCSTSTRPTTQGPFAMPDYYFEFRRQQAAAIEAAARRPRRGRGRVRAAVRAAATARSRSTASTTRRRAIVALGSTAGTVKDVVDELRDERRAGRAPEARVVPALPRSGRRGRARRMSRASSCSTAPTRPAARRHCTPRSPPRSTAAAVELAGARLRPRRPRPAPAGRPRRVRRRGHSLRRPAR